MAKQTRDNPLPKLAGKRSSNAQGQSKKFIEAAQEHRNEAIAKHRKKTGKASHAIHGGRPTKRGRFVNGKFVWKKVG